MPELTAAHHALLTLAGRWEGPEELAPAPWDPEGGSAFGRMHLHPILDGLFLASDYEQERAGVVAMRGHGVYGWDAERAVHVMTWFDTTGGRFPLMATGAFTDGALCFEREGEQGDVRYVYRRADDALAFRIEQRTKASARWEGLFVGRYRLVG